nr:MULTISPECIES: F0F1 ATP synthase subunit B [unclassified Adlercreutzia]
MSAASSFILPVAAFASEEGGKTGIALILPDMNEFIPMLIAFLVIAVVLAKFGWPVVDNIIEKREAAVKDALEKSEAARIESERLLEEYRKQLEEAKSQSAQIIADAKKTGESVKADITAKAQGEAEVMVEKARVAIESEKKAAIAELQSSVADTSIAVASRLIGQDLSDDEHRAIIERYVNEAGSFNAD